MKLLIGGSPCTHWSIAQTKNRETTAEGVGWELFQNYVIALKKFRPDYFLYENNKSMSKAILEQITKDLGVKPVLINSALVSAQNRQRLYWVGRRNQNGTYSQVVVDQPQDRGILLRDILESGVSWLGKAYTMKANYAKTSIANLAGCHFPAPMAAEPVKIASDGKAQRLRATYYKDCIRNMVGNTVDRKTCVAEPVRIGTIESKAQNADFDSQQYRVYSLDGKAVTLCGQSGGIGAKTGLYAVPFEEAHYSLIDGAEILIANGKIRQDDSRGTKQGKYVYLPCCEKSNTISAGQAHNEKVISKVRDTAKYKTVYEVHNGQITIKDKQYPIKLSDGFYIIRKLTVTECKRLQTVPEDYIFPVSDTQAYKMLGNGWTVDVIAHIMSHFDGLTAEQVDVLSMYDGMACGHIALDKLGANVRNYLATEIDKYAIKTATHNFPDIVELGDAFLVRDENIHEIQDLLERRRE